MSQSELEYLQHILDEAEYPADIGRKVEKEQLLQDETLKRAVVRSIEIIGEATKQLSDELRERYSNIEWRSMARMRDRLIHGYFSIDYDIVLDVIKNEAPKLQGDIEKIIQEEA